MAEENNKINIELKPRMSNEEAKKEIDSKILIKNSLKALNGVKPSGLVAENVAILPLDVNEYVYNVYGKKGIVNAVPVYKGERGTPPEWHLDIEGVDLIIEGKPLNNSELVFNLPNKELVKKFVKNEVKAPETYDLYNKLRDYFKRFVELHDESYYDALVLYTFQTWLTPVLDSVFFLALTGGFGCGKTLLLETVKEVCKHGYIPNPSVAFIGRCMDKLKISLFIDEFDIMGEKDNELYMLVRMCQRRGQCYTRMADKGQSIESFDTFGPVAFTVHGMVESALETRSIPIYTTETDKKILSKLGSIRRRVGQEIYDQLYLWFFDNIITIYGDYLQYTNELISVMDDFTDDDEANLVLMNKVKFGRELTTTQIGRNSELEDVMLLLLKYLGFIHDDNKISKINEMLNLKNELLEQNREVGNIGYLRDCIITLYTKHKSDNDYRNEDGLFMISNIEVSEEYQKIMKNKGLLNNYSVSDYRGMMRDLGFDRGKNYKKLRIIIPGESEKKVRSSYIFDNKVQTRLQVKIELLLQGQQRTFVDDFNEKEIQEHNNISDVSN